MFLNYGRTYAIEACISSKVLPLVSGTSFAMKRTVRQPMAAKMKNVPAVVKLIVVVRNNKGKKKKERKKKLVVIVVVLYLRSSTP